MRLERLLDYCVYLCWKQKVGITVVSKLVEEKFKGAKVWKIKLDTSELETRHSTERNH